MRLGEQMKIRGFTSLILSVLLIIWFNSNAFSYSLLGVTWPNAQTTVYSVGGNSTGYFNNAFVQAMNNWNGLSGFNFYNANNYMDPCANPNSYGPPWDNGWAFANNYCGIAFGGSTLAVCRTWYSGGDIVQASMIFNSNKPWSVFSGSNPNSFDFRRVATHELGHALGLGHSSSSSALMYPYYGSITTPQSDDINGLIAMYSGGSGGGGNCGGGNVAVITSNGYSLSAVDCGGGDIHAHWIGVGSWELFELRDLGNNKVAIITSDGHSVSAVGGGGGDVHAHWIGVGGWEIFELIEFGNNKVAFKTINGHYLSAAGGGGGTVHAYSTGIGASETFTLTYR